MTVPIFRGPKDNFLFWSTRIKSILAEKDVEDALDWDNDEVPNTKDARKKVTKA